MKQIRAIFLIPLLGLAACAQTRDPDMISINQANDHALTCEQLATEYKTNGEIAALKITKNTDDDTRDFLLIAFIWPGLADYKNADGIEGNALLDRNIHLRALAANRNCNQTAWPPQPERYS